MHAQSDSADAACADTICSTVGIWPDVCACFACRDAAPQQRLGAAAAALTLSVALLGGEIAAPPPLTAAPLVKKSGGGTDEQARLEELLAGEQSAEAESLITTWLALGAACLRHCVQPGRQACNRSSAPRI